MNSNFKKILVGLFFFTTITNCNNNTDYQTIHDAQLCLDKATAATAQTCINMVAGMSGAAASMIRCAGTFVLENKLTTAGLASITSGLQGGSNQTTTAMAALVLSSSTVAATIATECAASGSGGMAMLGSMASIATTTAALVGGCTASPSATCLQNGLTAGNASTILTNNPAISTAVATAYTQNCSSSSSNNAYQSFCTQYAAAAAGGGDAAAIATRLLGSLK